VPQPGTRYAWNLPDLPAGGSAWITVSGAYSDTLAPGTPLILAAEVNTRTPEASTANNLGWMSGN